MGFGNLVYAQGTDLHPVNPPVGVYPQLCFPQLVTLAIKEKMFSLSGDNFSIIDANTKMPILSCDGKAFSLRDRKHIRDTHGNILFNVGQKMLAIHKTFVCEDASGKEVLRVQKKMSFGSKLVATFTQNGVEHELTLKGDFWGGSANITMKDGPAIAHISRKLATVGEFFGDKQTYFVSVAPGVDVALIATVCICFDEAKNEN